MIFYRNKKMLIWCDDVCIISFFTSVLPLLYNSMQINFKTNCLLKCWYFNNCILNHVTNVSTVSFTCESFNGKEISWIFNFYVLIWNSRNNLSSFISVFSRTCTFSWSETIKDTSLYIFEVVKSLREKHLK